MGWYFNAAMFVFDTQSYIINTCRQLKQEHQESDFEQTNNPIL